MTSKCHIYRKLLHRNISFSSSLNKHAQPNHRFRRMTVADTSKSSRVLDLKGDKNRSIWLKSMENEELVKGKIPTADVYFGSEYEKIKYSFEDAVQFHQDCLLDKSLLDSPNAVLKVNFLLNMKTKKTTKFVPKFQGIEIPPHSFTFMPKPKILVFCTDPKNIETAISLGAFEAGDEALVKKLEQGQIFYEEFDQVICHTDAASIIVKLKSILKEKLPTKQNNRIGSDIKSLVETYINGYEFESKKVEGIAEEANLTIPIGEINWPIDKLKDNFQVFFKKIVLHSSQQIAGDVVSKISLICPPSDEIFFVEFQEDLKNYMKMRQKTTVKEDE